MRAVPARTRQAVSWAARYSLRSLSRASYVDFHNGNLFVGDFYSDVMRRYPTSTARLRDGDATASYSTPTIVQGVQVTASHFVFSPSWGRDRLSKVQRW